MLFHGYKCILQYLFYLYPCIRLISVYGTCIWTHWFNLFFEFCKLIHGEIYQFPWNTNLLIFFFLSMVIILVILFVSRDSPFSVLFHFLKGFFPSTNKSYVTIDLLNIVNKNKHVPQLDKPWVSEHIYFLNPQLDMILWHPMKHTCIIKLYLPLHVHSYKIL